MKLTRWKGWSPLPFFLLFAGMGIAILVASPESSYLGSGIALGSLIVTGLLEGIVNPEYYKKLDRRNNHESRKE